MAPIDRTQSTRRYRAAPMSDRRPLPAWTSLVPPLATVALVFVLPAWGIWTTPGPPMEEGFMLVFPERLLAGDLPHRDFLHLYGPGSLWLLAAVYWIFGVNLWVQRVVGAVQIAAVAGGVFALLRPWGRWVAASGASVATLVLITPAGFTALAWVGAVALGLWAVWAAVEALEPGCPDPRRRRLLVVAGVLAGLALLFRLDLVVALGLAGLVVLWRLDGPGRRRLVVAGLAGLSPYLVHIATVGLGPVVEGMVLEPVFDLRGGRALPLPPSTSGFDGFLQRAWLLPDVMPPYPLPAFSGPVQMNLWLALLLGASGLLVVGGVVALRAGRGPRLLVMAAFALGLLPQALQRADSTHLAWVSCVTLGLLPAAVVELTGGLAAPRRGLRGAAAIAAVPLALLVAAPHFTYRSYGESVAQTFGMRRRSFPMHHDGRTFLYGRPDAVDAVNRLLPLVDELTEPGDRLFVGPADLRRTPYSEAFLYFLLPELVPATRYIEMDPGVANGEDSGLAREVASSDVLILSSIRDDWEEPNDSRLYGPNDANEVVRSRFCLVESYGEGVGGRGLYEVHVPCEADGGPGGARR